MERLSCSVIYIQYNPCIEKAIRTLYSIVMQKSIHIQLIIADDGSQNNYRESLEKYLSSNGFDDYLYIANRENHGTVINVWKALEFARYPFVSVISPGDYYYNAYTLYRCISILNSREYCLIFGRLVPYNKEGNEFRIFNRQMPYDHSPYYRYMKSGDYRQIKRNIIIFRDAIIGPTCFWKKEVMRLYLAEIIGRVKYVEDTICISAVLDEAPIYFNDEYVIWYEYGMGISTTSSRRWRELINKDINSYYEMLLKKRPKLNNLRRQKILMKFNGIGAYNSILIKCILFPDRFIYLFARYFLFKERMPKYDIKYLKNIYKEGNI